MTIFVKGVQRKSHKSSLKADLADLLMASLFLRFLPCPKVENRQLINAHD